MKKQQVITRLALLFGIIVIANMISSRLFFRIDFTADQRYTLSQATREVLRDLDEVVTIKAFFSEDLPPQLLTTRSEFRDQLVEYEKRSQGYVVYEFVNPNESDQSERDAQVAGINPLIVNVTERDQVQQLRAYMGAILEMEDRKEVIPIIEPGAAMEYALTSAIKKLSITDKPKLGLIQGHGEATLASIPQLNEQLQILYDVEPFYLSDSVDVPIYYQTLLWLNPVDSIPDAHLEKLDEFLANGGGLFLSYSNFRGNPAGGFISPATNSHIKEWLNNKGVVISDDLVTDVNCASVGVPQQLGPFSLTAQVQFPYFPIISSFQEHPVVTGLEALLFPLTTSVIPGAVDSSIVTTPLAFSSTQSGTASLPLAVDVNKEWTQNDFPEASQSVALALEELPGKMVVVGSGSFAVNGDPGQAQQVNPDNINFVANAVDWMSDDTGLNDLRTKIVTARPLKPVEESTKNLLKYGNVLVPILLVLLYALLRRQRNERKKLQWMQGKYQ